MNSSRSPAFWARGEGRGMLVRGTTQRGSPRRGTERTDKNWVSWVSPGWGLRTQKNWVSRRRRLWDGAIPPPRWVPSTLYLFAFLIHFAGTGSDSRHLTKEQGLTPQFRPPYRGLRLLSPLCSAIWSRLSWLMNVPRLETSCLLLPWTLPGLTLDQTRGVLLGECICTRFTFIILSGQ
jgi:hypothetical protein